MAINFLAEKVRKILRHFHKLFYLIYFGYNTSYITDYEELLLSLNQTVTQLCTTLSLNMSSRSKINCGHCGHLNTVEYALSNRQTAGHPLSNHRTVGHTL